MIPAPMSADAFEPQYSEEGPLSGGNNALNASGSESSLSMRRSLQNRRSGSLRNSMSLDMTSIVSTSDTTAGAGIRVARRRVEGLAASAPMLHGEAAETPQCRPRPRGWEDTSVAKNLPANLRHSPTEIKVMSYNVLADRYVSTDKYSCPVEALDETFRLGNVRREIEHVNPDVLILEEVTGSTVEDGGAFGASLEAMGYDKAFVKITVRTKPQRLSSPASAFGASAAGPSSDPGDWLAQPACPEHEGVAIFWKRARFDCQERTPLQFNTLAQRDAALSVADRQRVSSSSHNVAMVVVLHDKIADAPILVAGIHAYWNGSKPDIQLWQQVTLLREIHTIADMLGAAVILGGDFNAAPADASMAYTLTGSSASNTPDEPLGDTRDATHTFSLDNAYAEFLARHPDQVTAVGGHVGAIDHIFFDRDVFVCTSVLRLGTADEDCPNLRVPSDHFPVAAVLLPTAAL
jgi:mRNA deadenylase 3'-5' endonuclease subunit Ccr4